MTLSMSGCLDVVFRVGEPAGFDALEELPWSPLSDPGPIQSINHVVEHRPYFDILDPYADA